MSQLTLLSLLLSTWNIIICSNVFSVPFSAVMVMMMVWWRRDNTAVVKHLSCS